MSLNKKMGDAHEEHLVEVLGGRKTRGSGNQFNNPMDGRHNRYDQAVAFAWDGKSTRGKSIGVSREMIAKAREQAHGERPMLALRWYDDDRLRNYDDWVCIQLDDFQELRDRAEPDFAQWMQYALDRGWIAPGVCQTHDGVQMTAEEEQGFEAGHDPCVPVLRVWTEMT